MRMAGYRRLSGRLCDFPGDDCPYLMKASYSFVIFQGGGVRTSAPLPHPWICACNLCEIIENVFPEHQINAGSNLAWVQSSIFSKNIPHQRYRLSIIDFD